MENLENLKRPILPKLDLKVINPLRNNSDSNGPLSDVRSNRRPSFTPKTNSRDSENKFPKEDLPMLATPQAAKTAINFSTFKSPKGLTLAYPMESFKIKGRPEKVEKLGPIRITKLKSPKATDINQAIQKLSSRYEYMNSPYGSRTDLLQHVEASPRDLPNFEIKKKISVKRTKVLDPKNVKFHANLLPYKIQMVKSGHLQRPPTATTGEQAKLRLMSPKSNENGTNQGYYFKRRAGSKDSLQQPKFVEPNEFFSPKGSVGNLKSYFISIYDSGLAEKYLSEIPEISREDENTHTKLSSNFLYD